MQKLTEAFTVQSCPLILPTYTIVNVVQRVVNVVLIGMSEWQRCVYWKLIVALPVISQQSAHLSDWISHKLSVGRVPSKPADSQVNTAAFSSQLSLWSSFLLPLSLI